MRNDCVIAGNSAAVFISNQQHHNQNLDALAVAREIKGNKNIIMDFGCGFGSLEKIIFKKARMIYAIDESKGLINYAKKNNNSAKVKFVNADVAKYKMKSNSADYCIMLFSIHHTKNKINWLDKAYSSLKNGGKLIIVERVCRNRLASLIFPLYWFMFYKRKHEWSEEMPLLFQSNSLRRDLTASNLKLHHIESLSYGDADIFKRLLFRRQLIVAEKVKKSV
jgi:ubiquinone/menaquinone biosynthesis C-methylase UbiE